MSEEAPLPMEHVERPRIPWRETMTLTECGLNLSGQPVISRAEFLSKVKRQGAQRARLSTCWTCAETASRHPTWEENPAGAILREVERWRIKTSIVQELRALAILAIRHREEFKELLDDQAEIVPIRGARTS